MQATPARRSVDLSTYPDLVVVYLGFRVTRWRGLLALMGVGRGIAASVRSQPDGLLAHENLFFGLTHVGMRQYWRDLDSLERRAVALEKKAKGSDKEAKEALDLVNRALPLLREGKPARLVERKPEEERLFQSLGLMTAKPVLYVCNVDEGDADKGNAHSDAVFARAKAEGAVAVVVSAKIESEIAVMPAADQGDFLEAVGLTEPGLNRVIRAGYDLLGLVTYFTVGPKEARAWTITKGTRAPGAAGVIHSDFEKGFIRAETIAFKDYTSLKGESGARDAGKLRLEGKEYVVQDGDVLHFRFAN